MNVRARGAGGARSKGPVAAFVFGALAGLGASVIGWWLTRRLRFGCATLSSARNPVNIGGRGWKQVLLGTWREFREDRIPAVAAAATFYGLLALFPAIGAFVSLYGLFAHVEDAKEQIAALKGVFPEGGITVITDQLARLAAAPHARLGTTFALSLVLSVVSSNAGMKSVIEGLNVAYEERERRNAVVLNLVSLAFTVGAIGIALLSVAAISAAPAILDRLSLGNFKLGVLRWPALLALVAGGLSLLYRYGPARAHARWRWVTPGGGLAAVGWLAMSIGYSVYVENFGNFNKTYGSFGEVVGFMTWIWLSLIVVLLGAELNSELELETTADTTKDGSRPAGLRAVAVADGERQASR